ncbi:acyl-CoA dehydrogenase family protein [Vibrio sp. Of7-15]|uniref:acyl-CoA dehydrogenase family protein n=1 Tax=Vibrio sp. Of7-15 TaxID=2724879 RepID=UPI001EF3D2D6|nr:acyl-CoA dehydrogenase family protein [Vibrio sp. Of7-15]MCG7495634.1 acyl-CoA dehydrogenase family protein [Vibrio sp. Of7-15]
MNLNNHPLIEEAKLFSDQHIRSNAGEFEQTGVPQQIVDLMAEKGFLGSVISKEYGGAGVDPYTYGRITEEIGKGCNSVRALLTVHTSLVGETLERLGTEEQKATYLPLMTSGEKLACFALSEVHAGSDAASISTSYAENESSFVLSGKKRWISFAGIADLFLVFAANEGVISAFLVDRAMPGVSISPMSGLMASKGAHLAEIAFENVEVPKENLVGKQGMGFSFVANTALFYGRYSIAWGGVAIMAAAIEEMVTYARTRTQFGKKLGQHQLIQAMIADSTTSLHAGRSMCEKIALLRDNNDDQAVMETNIAKLFTSRAACEVSSTAVQVLGGNGLWNGYPVERLYREAKVLEIIEGTTQIQQMMISNFALRRYFRKASKRVGV